MQDLDAVLPLALFLAHERNKGQDSFWQPYLGLLPEQPGCAWLMAPAQLSKALKAVKQLVGKSFPYVYSTPPFQFPHAVCLAGDYRHAVCTHNSANDNISHEDEAGRCWQVLLHSCCLASTDIQNVAMCSQCVVADCCGKSNSVHPIILCLYAASYV